MQSSRPGSEGIHLIQRKLQTILETEGVEPIPAEGQTVRPDGPRSGRPSRNATASMRARSSRSCSRATGWAIGFSGPPRFAWPGSTSRSLVRSPYHNDASQYRRQG